MDVLNIHKIPLKLQEKQAPISAFSVGIGELQFTLYGVVAFKTRFSTPVCDFGCIDRCIAVAISVGI